MAKKAIFKFCSASHLWQCDGLIDVEDGQSPDEYVRDDISDGFYFTVDIETFSVRTEVTESSKRIIT